MPFQPVPNVAQITVQGRIDGQLTINDLYWEIAGGGITPTNLFAITNQVKSWVGLNLATELADEWTCETVQGRDLTVEAGAVVAVASGVTGGSASEPAPNNVAACISFRTGFAGRSGRGRNYIPAIPNDQVTINTMQPTFMDNLLIVYSGLVGPGTFLPGWQWCVVSRQAAGVLRPAGVPFPITSAIFTRPYVASMRSRSVGHGS